MFNAAYLAEEKKSLNTFNASCIKDFQRKFSGRRDLPFFILGCHENMSLKVNLYRQAFFSLIGLVFHSDVKVIRL